MENETDREVERIAKLLFLPGMDDATKAFLAHNYLADSIDYTLIENATDLETSYMQSAYGALIKKKCVCQGYAEAFKRIMDFEGIPCDIVCGKTKDSTTYHAWNILKLNNERDNYHIDVTWDSSDERVSYKYFGLKDSDFIGQRTWSREYNATCNSSKNLLALARWGVMRFKTKLLANGVSPRILG
jgi:transglutaminase/protease-like cytokinesis protein 3